MHGGDEYGVPTVPTARKMAIQVGGVSAPNLKTFLLGPGKTAFVARFEPDCDDSFNSDDVSAHTHAHTTAPAHTHPHTRTHAHVHHARGWDWGLG